MIKVENLEMKIAIFLRWGVVFAGLLMLTGWILSLPTNSDPFFVYQTYDPISFQDLLKIHLKNNNIGALISYAGLVSLIALPLIRVLFTAILFIAQKEKQLALIAFLVLIALLISFSLGIEHQ